MLIDMHTHSENSHDSTCPLHESALAAVEKGIKVLALTDHCDIQYYKEGDAYHTIRKSNEDATRENELFGDKLLILRGIELGDATRSPEYTHEILESNEYDVVIASVHESNTDKVKVPFSNVDFSLLSEGELDDFLNQYFDDLLFTLKSVPCDIAAHLTVPLRYINGKYKLGVDAKRYEDKITKILSYIIDHNIALEVNTAGACGSFMPDTFIIEKYKKMGGYLVTIGSDAHRKENVGGSLSEAAALLKKLGFENQYYYVGRKPVAVKL